MTKKIIISILCFILLVLLIFIYFGTPNEKAMYESYNLSNGQLVEMSKLANEDNSSAMQLLMNHYLVNKNKEKFLYWKNKKLIYDAK